MKLEIEHKIALVTASSGGIGLEIARSLAAENAKVVINGRTQANVYKAIADILQSHPNANLIPLVSDNGTQAGCEITIKQMPQVDILVNNLEIYEANGFFDETDDDWQRLFEVNVMSGVRLARHCLAKMLAVGLGRVIFISSESGIMPAPEMGHYSATKTMQLGISRALGELTKNTNVTVNAVLPGPTLTDSVEKKFMRVVYSGLTLAEAETKFMAENRLTSLISRLIKPSEIGDIVTFICSERASIINGTNI